MDENYESLVTNILAMMGKDNITVEEVYLLMLSHESRTEMSKEMTQNEILHDISSNFAQR